jgi:hypothetical protein
MSDFLWSWAFPVHRPAPLVTLYARDLKDATRADWCMTRTCARPKWPQLTGRANQEAVIQEMPILL